MQFRIVSWSSRSGDATCVSRKSRRPDFAILRPVVFRGSRVVFVENDVERPCRLFPCSNGRA